MVSALILYDRDYTNVVHGDGSNILSDILENEVLPYLCAKLSRLSSVSSISLFCANDNGLDKALERDKTRFLPRPNNLTDESTIESVLEEFSRLCEGEHVLVINPMFPFVTLASIELMINAVDGGGYESALGVSKGGLFWWEDQPLNFSVDSETMPYKNQIGMTDHGAVYVLKVSNIARGHSRVSLPAFFSPMSTLEQVTLRNIDDWDLVELVFNSGIDRRGWV